MLAGMLSFKKNLVLKERVLYSESDTTGSCITPVGRNGKILLIPIQGIINEGGYISDSSTSPAYIERVLKKAKKDSSIQAVLLYINSPGGTVTASDMIYRQIQKYKKSTEIPVYAHFATLGASGAYYAAMASPQLNARPTARIGSIGVIIRSFSLQGLLEKYGVRYQPVATGKNKDTGSMFKDMSEEEKEFLKTQLTHVYDSFINIILNSRKNKIPKETLLELANGKVYNAQFAKKSGLIDSLDYFDEYISKISKETKIDDPVVVALLPDYMPATNVHELDISIPMPNDFQLTILRRLSMQKMFYMWNHSF